MAEDSPNYPKASMPNEAPRKVEFNGDLLIFNSTYPRVWLLQHKKQRPMQQLQLVTSQNPSHI